MYTTEDLACAYSPLGDSAHTKYLFLRSVLDFKQILPFLITVLEQMADLALLANLL